MKKYIHIRIREEDARLLRQIAQIEMRTQIAVFARLVQSYAKKVLKSDVKK